MIKKIIIIFFLIFSISNTAFSKSPPLGTGSLVPSNIMIMLDNSGSMGWNLAGQELSTVGELNRPTEIKNDSAGNIYVLQTSNTYFQGKNYRMHVFNSDGTFKKTSAYFYVCYWFLTFYLVRIQASRSFV